MRTFLLTATFVLLSLARPVVAVGSGDAGFLRGMTVSCPRAGQIWGTPRMAEALAELRGLGVDWVAIHPYAGVDRAGRIRDWLGADDGYLRRAAKMARDADVELFWKPHLGYWGSFAWRGEIEFADEAAWQRFFAGYEAFIVGQARLAEELGVTLFAVGVELEKTTHREVEWRRLIAAVRGVYSGRITYAANWDSLDAVPFWDAVDLIGVQAYFPLSYEPFPSMAAIERGWTEPLAKLRDLSRSQRKRVLLTEIGYDATAGAAREPWQGARGGDEQEVALRLRLVEVALRRLEDEPFLAGLFWWKWMPGERHLRSDFSMRRPEVTELLGRYWKPTGTAAGRP